MKREREREREIGFGRLFARGSMSPTVTVVLVLSLLPVLPLPAAEAGEITDLLALIRNTLKYWRRVYQTYEEEVTLGYCWAEYLLRRGHDEARNASEFVDPPNLESTVPLENDSFEKEQWNQWVFAVQGHGARGKRSYLISQTCGMSSDAWRRGNNESSEEKDDAKLAREGRVSTTLEKNFQRRRRPRDKAELFPRSRLNLRSGGIETRLKERSKRPASAFSRNLRGWRISRNIGDLDGGSSRGDSNSAPGPRDGLASRVNKSGTGDGARRELNRETSTNGRARQRDPPAKYEGFLRNLARRGGRSTEIPNSTDIGEISKIARDALLSSTRPSGRNKTKFKLNELCSRSRDTMVDETKDTRGDYSRSLASKRLVETPSLVGSSNAEELSNSWKGIPGERGEPMDEVRRVKVSSNGQRIGVDCESRSISCARRRTVSPPIVVDTRPELLFSEKNSRSLANSRERDEEDKPRGFDLEFRNVDVGLPRRNSRGKRDANDRTRSGQASSYNSRREVPRSSRRHDVWTTPTESRPRDAPSIKHEPVGGGVSKFRASSDRRSTFNGGQRSKRVKNRRGRNDNSKQSSLANIGDRFVGRNPVGDASSLFVGSQRFMGDYGSRSRRAKDEHGGRSSVAKVEPRELMLFHFQQVFTAFLTTLGFFVNVGRQLMDYVDSNSALACTKDYILGKAVHWIDS